MCYLIIANSGIRPLFTIYQTVYDSPSRDNGKIPQIAKYVLPKLIVSEKMSILQKIQISVISIIKNHPSKLPFGLLNIIQPC